MRKKILFVITKSNWGGAQRYVYDLATGLPTEDFEVVVALGGAGALKNKLETANIRTISLSSLERDINPLRDVVSFFVLWKLFRTEHPDIVHLNSAKASGLGALAGRVAGIRKIIFTAHGWAFNEERSILFRLVVKIVSWITVILSHKTIAVSKAVQNDTNAWPFIKNKVTTVYNGVEEIEFFTRDEARASLLRQASIPLPQSAFIVGTIAELHKNKGLEYSIKAFAGLIPKNPELYYFILGDGEEKECLNALVEHHKLQGRVFLLGFVEDASRYLKAFDAFILPSVKEGLPYVILEAGLAGLSVIASEIGGIPEIIENEKTGLFIKPRDTGGISTAIHALLNNQKKYSELGNELKKRVSCVFSLKKMLEKTIEEYH